MWSCQWKTISPRLPLKPMLLLFDECMSIWQGKYSLLKGRNRLRRYTRPLLRSKRFNWIANKKPVLMVLNLQVAIYDRSQTNRSQKKNAVLQRTAVQSNCSKPIFNHTFKFPKLPADSTKRIHIEVWHRDRTTMWVLCMISFSGLNAIQGKAKNIVTKKL